MRAAGGAADGAKLVRRLGASASGVRLAEATERLEATFN